MTGVMQAVAALSAIFVLSGQAKAQAPAQSWLKFGNREKVEMPANPKAPPSPAVPMTRSAAMAASPGPETAAPESMNAKPTAASVELPATILITARLFDDVIPIPVIPPDTAEPPLADSVGQPILTVAMRSPALSPIRLDTAPRLPAAYTMQFPAPFVIVVEPSSRAGRALAVLSEPASAPQRCRAADELDEFDLCSAPELMRKLVASARQTCSIDERLAFVRALVRGKAAQPEVLTLLQALTDDATPAIRTEATIGLTRLRQVATLQ